MTPYLIDWLNLAFRWMHFIFGAAWIGTSFYFNWVNNSLRKPDPPRDGVLGELWAVHGGAYYTVTKHSPEMAAAPSPLHWFKYEAYFTWISGFCLLGIVYHSGGGALLLGGAPIALSHGAGIGVSVGSMVLGWLVYDGLCKSPISSRPLGFALIGFALSVAMAYGFCQVFSPRAAYLHVGAVLGTCMAANVFFVIIPGQRAMVTATKEDRAVDVRFGQAGALRSLHNNYLTLPVLFIMVSNHFPMTWGHTWNWGILAALALIGMGVRHYFNLKGKGQQVVWILPVATLAMIALAFIVKPTPPPEADAEIPYAEIAPIVKERCQPCHSVAATHPVAAAAPEGLHFDSEAQVVADAVRIETQLATGTMPFGNVTQMTDDERTLFRQWLAQGPTAEGESSRAAEAQPGSLLHLHVPSKSAEGAGRFKADWSYDLVVREGWSVHVHVIPPGQLVPPHHHPENDELSWVASGVGEWSSWTSGQSPIHSSISAGDAVVVPAGAVHGLRNPGPENLSIVVLQRPSFGQNWYLRPTDVTSTTASGALPTGQPFPGDFFDGWQLSRGGAPEDPSQSGDSLYLVSAGAGMLRFGDTELPLQAGHFVAVPQGRKHSISADEGLQLLRVRIPRYNR